jgi:chromate transporter
MAWKCEQNSVGDGKIGGTRGDQPGHPRARRSGIDFKDGMTVDYSAIILFVGRGFDRQGEGMANRAGTAQLGWAFLIIGAVAFGGLGATLALLQRELVERRGWLQPADVSEALAYTKPLPGSTVVQVVTFLGWRINHWPGAIVATAAFLLPALIVMTVAAAAVLALPDDRWVRGGLTGLQVAVVGLLAAALWNLARSEARSLFLIVVLVAAFAAGLFVNAAIVVAAAGVVGIGIDRAQRHA